MRKEFTLAFLLSSGIWGLGHAQLPVSTTPQNKKVVLEEFTGIYCVWCPDGHKMANELKAAKPAGSVVLVNIHTGSYANPLQPGDPDFRTPEGDAIRNISGMNIQGYPTGAINRHLFPGESGMAVSRTQWNQYADDILAQPSYVNVALEGTLDVSTRELTVNVEAYYTDNSPVPTNQLTVVLMEDEVYGPQVGAEANYPAMVTEDGEYTHNHLLRKVLTTNATGEVINTTSLGTTVNKTYTYIVPADFKDIEPLLGNLRIAAYITESDAEVITAAEGPITLTGFDYTSDAGLIEVSAQEREVCAGFLTPKVKLYNNGSDPISSAEISYSVNGGASSTYTFSGAIEPATFEKVTLPEISFTAAASNTVNVIVTDVNGAADPNPTNSDLSGDPVDMTARMASDNPLVLKFTQDRYGSESTWELVEEATATVVADGGPYQDLSTNGTEEHVHDLPISEDKCYVLKVYDDFGDGINSGYGAGKYELLSGSTVLVSSDGKYGKGESSWFKSDENLLDIESVMNVQEIQLYPNPATNHVTVSLSLKKATNVKVDIVDILGRPVQQHEITYNSAGTQIIQLSVSDLAPGIYTMKLQASDGVVTKKFTVTK